MNYKNSFLTLILLLSAFNLFAQTDTSFLNKAGRSLSNYSDNSPAEKVYLHLDRPNYFPGDTIWFKAYTVIGSGHQLSGYSGVLYAELVNPQDSVVSRHALKLLSGLAWGEFPLPRALKMGAYHIRAYTTWMRNAGPDYFFNQRVRIGGLQVKASFSGTVEGADVQFFPEGGALVDGVRSRVAVKSVGTNGLGEDIKGDITDNEGNHVAIFSTQHLGMGVFALIPQPGKTYKANVITADSSKFSYDLPSVKAEGFTLAVNGASADSIYIKVATNSQFLSSRQNSAFYLVGQSAGKVYYTAAGTLKSPVFTTMIPKAYFPSGIVQFTLFSQEGEPVNERVIFIRNDDTLRIKLSSPVQSYAARQKVKISINVKSPDSAKVSGAYSVSVINETRVPSNENDESTILNNLLLTSDIKGFIEQPNYYFNSVDDRRRADLDLLMLTQGYRRFEWKKVLNPVPSLKFPVEKDLDLAGVLKTPSGNPVPNGKIAMLATREKYFADTVTDARGNFRFTNVYLPDTAKIVLRARKENKGTNVMVYVQQKDYPEVVKDKFSYSVAAFKLTPEAQKSMEEYQAKMRHDSLTNGINLKGVTIKGEKSWVDKEYTSYGVAHQTKLDMKQVRRYGSVSLAYASLKTKNFKGRVVIDGLLIESLNNRLAGNSKAAIRNPILIDEGLDDYSPEEIEDITLVEPAGYDPIQGKISEVGYIVITTKHYAGTDTTVLKSLSLKGVDIKSKRNNKPDMSASSNLHGGGNADQVIMGDKMTGCVNVSDCLSAKAFGVTFTNGIPMNTRGGAMAVVLDGVILDGSSLNDINKDDIYSVEVLRSGISIAIYGSSIPKGGALVITTRRFADPNYVTSTKASSGLITYPFKGYHMARAFYSPKYDHPKTADEPFDARRTIFWAPNIITGKDGSALVEYYNADTKGTYKVVIEGIDENGNIGRQVYRYMVE